jgi:hypothetical protein
MEAVADSDLLQQLLMWSRATANLSTEMLKLEI